ncbi:MAG: Hsp20/alpha crystallin family protein [Actinobacteria bacterium]|nr:MAG: Hsp20/alpha crystallin family protein [Actinomycetota bacterium]
MALTKWNPLEDVYDIQRDISKMFRRAFGATSEQMTSWMKASAWIPALDVYTKDNLLVIKAELPGVAPEDVDVSITENTLTITGERKQEKEIKEKDVFMMESSYGKFRRSLSLPKNVKADQIKANFNNGVLEVVVPQIAPEIKPQKVEIQTSQ